MPDPQPPVPPEPGPPVHPAGTSPIRDPAAIFHVSNARTALKRHSRGATPRRLHVGVIVMLGVIALLIEIRLRPRG